jgi:hypothetical protein
VSATEVPAKGRTLPVLMALSVIALVAFFIIVMAVVGFSQRTNYQGEFFAIGPRPTNTPVCHVPRANVTHGQSADQPCSRYPSPQAACAILRPRWSMGECVARLKGDNAAINQPYQGQVLYMPPSHS